MRLPSTYGGAKGLQLLLERSAALHKRILQDRTEYIRGNAQSLTDASTNGFGKSHP